MRGWPMATIAFYRSKSEPSNEGRSRHRAIRECRGEGVARLESGPRGRSRQLRSRPGDIGIYGEAWSAIGRDNRRNNRLPAPGGESTTKANGVRLASSGRDEIALLGTGSINFAGNQHRSKVTGRPSASAKDVTRWLRAGLTSESDVGHFRPRQRTLPRAHFRFAPKADVKSR